MLQLDEETVIKSGSCVWPNEEAALNLIHSTLPANSVPVPRAFWGSYQYEDDNDHLVHGSLWMEYMPGKTLGESWPTLDAAAKERVCCDTWALIAKLREIPRPKNDDGALYLRADGSSRIVQHLLADWNDVHPPMKTDEDLRKRIWGRYVEMNGLSFPEGETAFDRLPRSDVSVFTHGDIHPGNILVEPVEVAGASSGVRITALLDFELAGWYPDYWELSEIMRPCWKDDEWKEFMDRTKPKEWDVSGIMLMRRVLF